MKMRHFCEWKKTHLFLSSRGKLSKDSKCRATQWSWRKFKKRYRCSKRVLPRIVIARKTKRNISIGNPRLNALKSTIKGHRDLPIQTLVTTQVLIDITAKMTKSADDLDHVPLIVHPVNNAVIGTVDLRNLITTVDPPCWKMLRKKHLQKVLHQAI